jgi:D-3-phosphoglycerate dehydrogenase
VKKLRGFSVRILVNDPYIRIPKQLHQELQPATLNELFEQCDVISFHVPLSDETSFMINEKFLDNFKKPVYLINTSRGKILDTSALVTALEKDRVKGAGLDVLEFESLSFENLAGEHLPLPYRKLLEFDNVILSPHIAGWTVESHRKISEVLASKILSLV